MPLSKIQGIDGQVTPNLGRRNLIINGAMQVAQRGSSAVTVTTAASYRTVDRWKTDIDGSAGHDWSHEQSTDAPVGFGHSSKITIVTSGTQPTSATTAHQFYSLLEKQDVQRLEWGTSNAKAATVSFYVKSSVTGNHGFRIIHYDSSSNAVAYNTHYTINTANTWERKTITVTGPTSGGIVPTATAQALFMEFKLGIDTTVEGLSGYQAWESTNTKATEAGTVYLPATSGATWFITGIQLEAGDQSTPFEHRSYGEELALCQRYYWQLSSTVHGNYPSWVASAYSTAQMNWQIPFPVTMRTVPTMTYNTGNVNYYRFYRNSGNHNFGGIGTDTVSSEHINVYGSATSSHTAGTSGTLQVRLADGAGIFASAEL